MSFVADDALFLAASEPQVGRLNFAGCGSSELNGKQQAQAKQRHLAVGVLAACFSGKSGDPGGLMDQLNGSFHLISMLAAWATVATGAQDTVCQQLFRRQTGRMVMWCGQRGIHNRVMLTESGI